MNLSENAFFDWPWIHKDKRQNVPRGAFSYLVASVPGRRLQSLCGVSSCPGRGIAEDMG